MTESDPRILPALSQARSLLFVPGHRPERFAKALGSGADAVVLDLEDAVPVPQKDAARQAIAAAWERLGEAPQPVVIRLHSLATPAGQADLAWLQQLRARQPIAVGVMLAKSESASQMLTLRQTLPGLPVLPLIESAAGCQALGEIAAAPGVLRLVLGHLDFIADLGLSCSEDERELDPLRFAVSLQTRLAGLAPAVDGVTVDLDDETRLRSDTRRSLRFGFGGKLCIHPRQVAAIHAVLAPTPEEVAWAHRVLAADAAALGAAVQLDGRMVDRPVVLQARATVARWRSPDSQKTATFGD